MKLESVEIDNYRAIEHLCLPLHPSLTVLHGGNTCGKTSVLSAIAALKDELAGMVRADREATPPVELPIVAFYDTDRAVLDIPEGWRGSGGDIPPRTLPALTRIRMPNRSARWSRRRPQGLIGPEDGRFSSPSERLTRKTSGAVAGPSASPSLIRRTAR